MKYRKLGQTGLKVSEIGFGGASISGEGRGYGFGQISEKDAIDLLCHSVERGINLIDTAPIYGFGMSERRIGKAFLKSQRDKYLLVSKSGVSWHASGRVNMTNDLKTTENMLHQSLKDLNTDYIDLYMVHWPDEKNDIRHVMEFYLKAKEAGKIRFIGLCNTNLEDYKKASEICAIDVLQSELNFFNDSTIHDLFPLIKRDQNGFMSWGTLDKGILTGRLNEKRMFEDDFDCRKKAPWWDKKVVQKKIALVDSIKPIVEEAGHNLIEFALGYNLQYGLVSQVLCGARSKAQLDSLIKALDHLPNQSLFEKVKETITNE